MILEYGAYFFSRRYGNEDKFSITSTLHYLNKEFSPITLNLKDASTNVFIAICINVALRVKPKENFDPCYSQLFSLECAKDKRG
jgi:hypothetical protein